MQDVGAPTQIMRTAGGRAQDDWDSPIGSLRSRIESNTEMICNLGYQLEELKETIERLIRIIDPSPPWE